MVAGVAVDWGRLMVQLGAGDWTCAEHGHIRPDLAGIVPACPDCGAMALRVRIHSAGYPEFVEPRPDRCANGHQLGPGLVHLGWTACGCLDTATSPARGHRLWTCNVCDATAQWPPCMN